MGTDLLLMGIVLVVWIVIVSFVLPQLGVQT
jgi:hypothetical protein